MPRSEAEYLRITGDSGERGRRAERGGSFLDAHQSSSFIQSVLYEDSRAGVAVVDLFVAVKKVKDNLDLLSKSNSDALGKVADLAKETGAIRHEYEALLREMDAFFRRLAETAEVQRQKQKEEDPKDSAATPEGEKQLQDEKVREDAKGVTFVFVAPEPVVESVAASAVNLKPEESRSQRKNSETSTSTGTFDVSDSTIQMVCDVCEALTLARERGPEVRESQSSLEKFEDSLEEPEEEEDESPFQEALAEPSPLARFRQRPSVTCMGDLTRAAPETKSATTLTPANATLSWMRRLKEEIESKVRSLKPGRKAKVIEQPLERVAKSGAAPLEFSVSADTPVGVFDVTVRQYKYRRHRSRHLDDDDAASRKPAVGSATDRLMTVDVKDGDFFWSDENLNESDSDATDGWSISGDDDLEEFVEIVFENARKSRGPERMLPVHRGTGVLMMAALKTDKSPFFEITKCHPKHFVQEIIPKTAVWRLQRGTGGPPGRAVSPAAEGNRRNEIVIKDSSSDLVIYIQVQVEEDGKEETKAALEEVPPEPVRPKEKDRSPLQALKREEVESGDSEMTDSEETLVPAEEVEEAGGTSLSSEEEETALEKKASQKAVAEGRSEVVIRETFPEEEEEPRVRAAAVVFVFKETKLEADVLLPQEEVLRVFRLEPKEERVAREEPRQEQEVFVDAFSAELENALNLIREIEDNVVEVKLSDAILILPHLESELRKHLRQKLKSLGEREAKVETSVDNFFSAVDFWPEEESAGDKKGEDSQARLENLLQLLSDLEEAVKSSEHSKDALDLCDFNSSKIYKLLHALTNSIRELEDATNVVSLAETLHIASELDTAVRELDGSLKNQPPAYPPPEPATKFEPGLELEKDDASVRDHLKNVRKKVFEIVEEEAVDTEGRLEKDFDRVDRLAQENEEAIKFLEAFLEKTQRRTEELSNLKLELKELSSTLSEMYKQLEENARKAQSQALAVQKRQSSERETAVPLKNTISGLVTALDNLKIRAREKNEVCQEILASGSLEKRLRERPSRTSRSSFTATAFDGLVSSVLEFKKIGAKSLYLSWTKPEGSSAESIIGYEILVNERLNQKVRNPRRLQAVLYSIDFSQKTEVELHALLSNGGRGLLFSVTYLDM